MIIREWDLLFSKHDLRDVLDSQLRKLPDRVRKLSLDLFNQQTDEFLSASVASDLVVAPIVLSEGDTSVSSRETQIDVSRDPNRHFFEPGPHYIDGVEVTYHVPYYGEQELWHCRPAVFTFNPPRAVVGSDEIRFPVDSANREIAGTRKVFDDYMRTIKEWLPRVNAQVQEYNDSLEAAARQAVAARRRELSRAHDDIASLGFPVKAPSGSEKRPRSRSEDLPARRAAKRAAARREYDVALSFAGEDREYVDEVARELQQLGVTVFYDRFETVELWGKDLAEHLARVYSQDSHFVVMFASHHYAEKAWPSHERRHALSRAFKGDQERILPVRLDDSEVPGLASTIGYLDVRVLTPKKLAELIRQKLDLE